MTDEVFTYYGAYGGRLVIVNEGRDIHDVYRDEHMLGNSRVAPCSKQLKQDPCRRWIEANYAPDEVTLHVGIDWTEVDRMAGNQAGWAPYKVEAPLTEPPYVDKPDVLKMLRAEGIEPPRLYDLGFVHANCGGFCCRMGHTQAKNLLRVFPDRYAYHERREQEFRDEFGWDVAFLRDRTGGETTPLTMRELRERLERQPSLLPDGPEDDDTRGCATCFLADPPAGPVPPVASPADGSDHVVQTSSGVTSWLAGRRVAEVHGLDRLTLLFADVKGVHDENPHAGEDADNYRFLIEAAENILGRLREAAA